ncbi:hypothetical protein QZH46_11175 [Pseudomonas corrugata]
MAEPQQIDASFAEQIAKGSYKKISASFYHPTAANNPVPGVYYLRHVGFLGAQPPAVKGLRPIELAEGEPGVIEFNESAPNTTALEAENLRLKAELTQRDNAARIAAQQTLHATSVAYAEQLVAAGMKPLHAPVVIAALDAVQSAPPFGARRRRPTPAPRRRSQTLFKELTHAVSFTNEMPLPRPRARVFRARHQADAESPVLCPLPANHL